MIFSNICNDDDINDNNDIDNDIDINNDNFNNDDYNHNDNGDENDCGYDNAGEDQCLHKNAHMHNLNNHILKSVITVILLVNNSTDGDHR